MEELHPKPTPLPRSSPVGHSKLTDNTKPLKKPVPLPRSSAIPTAPSTAVEDKTSSENSSFEEVFTKGYNTLTKSIKNKLKSASENVQERSKAMLDTTKTVGLKTERSVRGMLSKRQSEMQKIDDNRLHKKVDRCQSLPSEDVFRTIKFGSPIHQENIYDNAADSDSDVTRFPPPEYPPPPLPDESLYDEISTKSSHSGSHGDYYTCSAPISSFTDVDNARCYKDVLGTKLLSLDESDTNSLQKSNSSLNTLSTNHNWEISSSQSPNITSYYPTSEFKSDRVTSCNSWSFYDTVDIPNKNVLNDQYVNVFIHNNELIVSNNLSNAEENPLKVKSEYKISCLKPLQPLKTTNELNDETKINLSSERQLSFISNTASETSSMSVPNELYTNWKPMMQLNNIAAGSSNFPAMSVFCEFDPLYEGYGKICKRTESLPKVNDEKNDHFYDNFDTVSLPVPPTRVDSIPDQPDIPNEVEYSLYHIPTTQSLQANKLCNQKNSKDHIENSSSADSTPCNSPETDLPAGKRKSNLARWSSMKRVIKKVTDASNWSPGMTRKTNKSKEDPSPKENSFQGEVERPSIMSSSGPLHSGFLFRSPSGGEKHRDFVQKWCQLAEGRLTFSAERNGSNKDILQLEHVYSLQIVKETKQSTEGEAVYCMEISCSMRDKPIFVGSPGTTERRIWMQRLLESLTLVFPSRLTAEYTRAGWCFLKEGINGDWVPSWVILHKRTLYFKQSVKNLSEIDLRKAITIVLQGNGEGCSRVAIKGPVIRVDCLSSTYYLQMNEPRESKAWCKVVREAAVENGLLLQDQQLTKDDMPTIIDKCINFVYAHGSMSEGIYRRSGSNTNVSKLLTAFQKDAFAVHITRAEYSEHDVASVLKRFFRELPEPLLTTSLHKVLCNATTLDCSQEEKVSLYRSLLEKLPPVNYVTTRRLTGHLYRIHQQCERNSMPADNLAAVWGPTLMHIEAQQPGIDPNWSKNESQVVQDLISLYPQLFHIDGAEIEREQRIQQVLERYHNSSEQTPHKAKPSGDIKIWIYINSKDSECVSVTVSPHKEALGVCVELSTKMNVIGHELCLLESVLDGALIRPLHHMEKVLDVVLRWGYWDNTDRKDNCLILVHNTIFRNISPYAKPPIAQCGELRFADLKSKSFKVCLFEFSQAKLCYFKDKMGSTKLGEWQIEDIIWYIGHEPKRNPHTRWSITFIPKYNRNKRSKECPYFGYTIAGTTQEEQLRWMAAMLVGEYPHVDIIPKPHINLLE